MWHMPFNSSWGAEYAYARISCGRRKLAELQAPENLKTIGGTKLIFGVKNSKIQMIALLKELVMLSRMKPKSTKLDDFGQCYGKLKLRWKNCFCAAPGGRLGMVFATRWRASLRPSFRSTCPASSAAAKTFLSGDSLREDISNEYNFVQT